MQPRESLMHFSETFGLILLKLSKGEPLGINMTIIFYSKTASECINTIDFLSKKPGF
jgi:hypothetical protein